MSWTDDAQRPRSLDEHIAWVKTWGHPMAETVKWLSMIREWQAIKTAPKDGEIVDLWISPHGGEGFSIEKVEWTDYKEDWWYPGTGCYILALGWNPTHWMRRSPPPRDHSYHTV